MEDDPHASSRWRTALAVGFVVLVLGTGLVLGFGDFFGRPDGQAADALPVQMSMAGFDPAVITARAGEALTVELWTTDAAPHLHNGVHTLISDELGIYEELPAESRRTVTLEMPTTPGDYDIYCDTCCGGKESPTMHGTLRVEA
jgi:plastocyanin